MKKCTKCGEEKGLGEFSKKKTARDGLRPECKICRNKYAKIYRQNHPETPKLYYETHKEELAIAYKKYYQAHKGNLAVKWKSYRQNHKEEIKLYRQSHKAEIRNKRLLKKYGLTFTETVIILINQNNKCLICKKEIYLGVNNNSSAFVDHDHKTGRTRGILCTNCNRGLGGFEDNIQYLKNAIKYLEESVKSIDLLDNGD